MFRLIVCSLLLTSYISACGDPLPGKGSSSDLGLLAVPTSLSFPDQSSSEEILSLTLVNPAKSLLRLQVGVLKKPMKLKNYLS